MNQQINQLIKKQETKALKEEIYNQAIPLETIAQTIYCFYNLIIAR